MSRQALKRWQNDISHVEARPIERVENTQFGDLGHSIIEDWHEGVYSVDVHFRIRRRFFSVEAGEYRVSFDRPVRKEFKVSRTQLRRKRNRSFGSSYTSRRRSRSAMLFPIGDRIYAPKVIDMGFLPAVVRLKSIKDSSGSGAASRKQSIDGPFPLTVTARERKLNAFLLFPILWGRKGECDMVKSRAQLVRNLTEEDAEFWRKRCDFRDPQMIPPLSIWLDRESIEVRFAMGLGDCIGSLEVGVSPVNLNSHKR